MMLLTDSFGDPTLESVFRAQVQANFGGTNYRGLSEQGVSWRLLALGQTLPAHRDVVDAITWGRSLSQAIGLPRSPIASRDILGMKQDTFRQPRTWLLEHLPEPLFIRFLESLRYPLVVYRASHNLWREVASWTSGLTATVLEAGEHFLGSEEAMTIRLRAGGLFPEERETFDVLGLGVLGTESSPRWLRDWMLIWDTLRSWLWGRKALTSSDKVQVIVRHQPLGLQVSTEWQAKPLLYTATQVDADTSFLTCADRMPPGESLPQLLERHAARVQLEMERRMAWLRYATKVIDLIITYIVLGPAGFVVIALRLLLGGLLSVTQSGRLALP